PTPTSTTRTPPHPPRFPYTTLFRSNRRHDLHIAEAEAGGDRGGGVHRQQLDAAHHEDPAEDGHRQRGDQLALAVEAVTHGGVDKDRKSTRLNSSHVKISYAVFCLKK